MIGSYFITVIIPCRNEKKFIGKCLDSIITNDYPKDKLEVLVMDGMSNDMTRDILKRYAYSFPFIRLLDNPKKTTPCALNIGIKNARGEVIMRMDGHATYEKGYISKCVKCLDQYNADNVGGAMITLPQSATAVGKAIALSLSSRFGVGNSTFRTGTKEPKWVDTVFGGCYRKEVFEKIGLFNECLASSQDMELNLRLKKMGGRILLHPAITSYYYARSDFKSFVKNNFRNGAWAILPFKFTDIIPVSWRHLVPLVFVLSLMGFGAFSFFSQLGLLGLSLIAILYLLCNIYFSLQIVNREKDLRLLFFMPISFAVLHFSYGLGSVWGLIKCIFSEEFWGKQASKGKFKKYALKCLFDAIFSVFGLITLAPLFLIIAILIKLEDKRPVFYRGVRIGRHGAHFRIFKFRTMVVNADKMGGPSTADDDPRITKIGKFLRKYKLDEMPQLINVFKGEMSFVGPRPEVPFYVDKFSEEQRDILTVKPGITDWASLWDSDEGAILSGSPDPEKTYMEKIRPKKLRLQLEYVRRHSFWVDLSIILQTIKTIFIR